MIPHNRPWITAEDRAAVDAVLASGWIAPGPKVAAVETAFETMLGGGRACAVSSGTAALFLALRGLGITTGDVVAVPTYACSALLNAVHMAGASSRPVDVRRDDYTIDPDSVRRLAPDARAAIAVHTYGASADIAALKHMGLLVVEDCCQSLGGPQGRLGDAAVFSFYATKVVTGGHGGLLWSSRPAVTDSARDYIDFDCRSDWTPRFNLQLTDLQAALVLSQMLRLDEIRRRRRRLRDRVRGALTGGLTVQGGLDADDTLPYRCVLEAVTVADRDRLRQACDTDGVATIIPVERYELLHRYLRADPAAYPAAEDIVDHTLSVPCYPALTDSEADLIGTRIGAFA